MNPEKNKSIFGFNKKKELKDKVRTIFSALVEKAQASRVRYETIMTASDFRLQIKQLIKQIHRVELVLIQVDRGQNLSLNLQVPVFQIEAG